MSFVRSFASKAGKSVAAKAAAPAAAKAAAPAAAKVVAGDHSAPIKLFGLHARYATATYIAASKGGMKDMVESELLAIQQSVSSNKAFGDWMTNPTISRSEKQKTCAELFGGKFSQTTNNLMDALAGNARLEDTAKVVDSYVQLMKASRGEVDATITSAEPLSKDLADQISKALLGQVGADKKVKLELKVDPSIMGGLQVQIGDQFMDLSVGSKISEVNRNLMS
jgi:F-type H+-transporting ATPase subunit O